MSKAEEDYSDYIQHLSNLGNMYTFLSGFMFTAITIILTQLPERTTVMAQIALFFMASLLDVFILFMGMFYMNVVYLCRHAPPYSGKPSLTNILSDLSVMLGFGGATILLFLTFGLVYLALAQLVVWLLASIVAYRTIFKPFYQRNKR